MCCSSLAGGVRVCSLPLADGRESGTVQVAPGDFVHCHSLLGPPALLLRAILLCLCSRSPSLFQPDLILVLKYRRWLLGPFFIFIAIYLVADLIQIFEEQTSFFCRQDAVSCFLLSNALRDCLLVTHISSCCFFPKCSTAFQSFQAAM